MNMPKLKTLPTQEEVDELRVQVEQLRVRLDGILEDMQLSLELSENDCNIWKSRIKHTLSATSAQCLAEIKAQTVEEFGDDIFGGVDTLSLTLNRATKEYANQIRQQAKGE